MSFFLEKNKIFLLIGFLVLGFFIAQIVIAGVNDNVSGWAWSENIGWISFNNTSGGGAIDYGVDIDTSTGVFSGYAWSENIGWISFNEADCPASPCRAELNFSTNEVSGWAKALDIDSWIRLRDTDYGVLRNDLTLPNELMNWAWSDTIIGWISFNCIDRNICGTSYYKVVVDIDSIDPVVDVFRINPVSSNWVSSTVLFDVSWTVSDDDGGSYLSHVEIWKAGYNDINCSDSDKTGCLWEKVNENYNVPPPPSNLWNSSVSDSPLGDGVWWYGLHVFDNMGNVGIEPFPPGPIKVSIDKTQPASQIQSPASNSWHSGKFSSGKFFLDTSDEDLVSGLDLTACKYKAISYDYYSYGCDPYCEYSTGWQDRVCNTSAQDITVGVGGNCPFEGNQSCWVYIRSRDNAGNWHSPYFEENSSSSKQYYNIDWTDPVVGEISPLTAVQGIPQTFTASLSDPVGKISGCWFYVDGNVTSTEFITVSPSPCENRASCTVSVNHTFFNLGNYPVKFSCSDAAMNVGRSPVPTTVTVVAGGSSAPIITNLSYYTAHASTPDQQCTDQFICCTEPTTQNNCNIKFNISAYDPDGNPLTYTWDFGDGGIESNEEDPSHHYYTANTFNVVVDVFDGSDHIQDNLLITVNNPTVSVGLTA
ncbi:MAG TPA: PKD domain-containing protein, partial [bacterium]|nr:PKD domain-containing protein [bacterium]